LGTRLAACFVDDPERMTVFWEYLLRVMLFRLFGATIILGAITGFVELSKGAFLRTLGGQIAQGVLSLACFIVVGVAFWRFGWKIGLLDLLLVIIASNVGLALHRVRLPGH
jgi:hypothetical protein